MCVLGTTCIVEESGTSTVMYLKCCHLNSEVNILVTDWPSSAAWLKSPPDWEPGKKGVLIDTTIDDSVPPASLTRGEGVCVCHSLIKIWSQHVLALTLALVVHCTLCTYQIAVGYFFLPSSMLYWPISGSNMLGLVWLVWVLSVSKEFK